MERERESKREKYREMEGCDGERKGRVMGR